MIYQIYFVQTELQTHKLKGVVLHVTPLFPLGIGQNVSCLYWNIMHLLKVVACSPSQYLVNILRWHN